MDADERLLSRLRSTRRNWTHRDLGKLLATAGFRAREGPHTMYSHSVYTDVQVNIPRSDPVPPVYAQRVLRALEEVSRREAESKERQ